MVSEKKTRRKVVMTWFACFVLAILLLMLMGLIHRSFKIVFDNGAFAQVTPASLWKACFLKGSCKIIYQPREGESGIATILQTSDSQLAMIMLAADGKSLLCLYDADVDLRLMRFDPTKKAIKFPPNSYLNYIIIASSWSVEQGTSNDWHEVSEYLKKVPPSAFNQQAGTKLDLGVFRIHYERDDLLSVVGSQITNMQHGASY
jgi:hypothetical protein